MCSIAGSYSIKKTSQMLKTMRHRAPDDQNIVKSYPGGFHGKPFYSAMGRLSILDLKSPNLCPYIEGSNTLLYNGEIYNYLDLRQELQLKGYQFKTQSDTEVVYKAWREWGMDCLNKFNGMFAFAIITPQKIYLARDIAGEKPLYYRRQPEFEFASEAKALGGQLVNSEFFETFQHCFGETLYKGVKELLPGHYAIYDLWSQRLDVKRWWEFKPRYINPETALDELEDLLKDAINIRTKADVPYGLYFSGGVDSSLIDNFHQFEHKFTFDPTKDYRKDFDKNIEKILYHLDFPVGSFSPYALYSLAREASKKVKVVLSGEGADEVFGGYIRYMPVATQYQMTKRYPSYNELFSKSGQTNFGQIFMETTYRGKNKEHLIELMQPFFTKYDPITAMQMFDFTYIMPSLLQMGDRMASAFGIENRCPFLDKRIIEFGLSLPPELKIWDFENKVLLKKLSRRKHLEIQEEKTGLVVPWNKWNNIPGYDRTAYFEAMLEKWIKTQR